MKMIQLLILFIISFSMDLWAGTCSSISRTANAANSVLTSTKYNLDHSTSYGAINQADGGCLVSGSVEKDSLNTTDFQVLQSAPKTGCRVTYLNASSVNVGPCRIAIDNDYTVTATNSSVAFACSGCSAEVTSASYFVYATTASATSSLDLLISTAVPDSNGYSGTSRVLGRFHNQGNGDISTSDVVSFGVYSLEPQTVFLKDIKAVNTAGGSATAGSWETRTLTDSIGDISIAPLVANQFTLQAGVYDIEAMVPAHLCNRFQGKLRNVTDSIDAIVGQSAFNDGGAAEAQTYSQIAGRVVLTSAKVFEIQMQVQTSSATNGMGLPANLGVPEVYTQVKIVKWR
jgi:hypothetical protein